MNTLTQKEMEQVEGGIAPVLLWAGSAVFGGIISGVVSNVLDNWGEFKQGVREGYGNTVNAN